MTTNRIQQGPETAAKSILVPPLYEASGMH
jgi:hypothetical protein